MSAGEKCAAAASLDLLMALLAYVVIIAAKLSRLEQELTELSELARERELPRLEREEASLGR